MKTVFRTAVASLVVLTSVLALLSLFNYIEFQNALAIEAFFAAVHALIALFDLVAWLVSPERRTPASAALLTPAPATGRTQERPVKRFFIFLFTIAFAVAAIALFVLPFLPEGAAGFVKKALAISHPLDAHVWGIVLFAYAATMAIAYALKNGAKHRKLLRLGKTSEALAKILSHRETQAKLDKKQIDARNHGIEAALQDLLVSTDKILGVFRPFSLRSVRTAWILIPDEAAGHFRPVHLVRTSTDADYSGVEAEHRPKMWDKTAFDKILADWQKAAPGRSDLRWLARRQKHKDTKAELRKCGSLTGFIFEQDRVRTYKKVTQCEVFDSSYIEHLPEDQRNRLMFNSAAGMALRVGGRAVAVLMLYGTVNRSFGEPDTTTIRTWAHILSPYVADNIALGVYNE